MENEKIVHPIDAVYDKNSTILILGSFPSVKSREYGFFYGHPQNRFWRVIATVYDESLPETIEDKKAFLLRNKVALWDVIASCEIKDSADSSIRNVVPNDLSSILDTAKIEIIFVNGRKAEALYQKYLQETTGITAVCLPSTSPANAAWSYEKLLEYWKNAIKKVK